MIESFLEQDCIACHTYEAAATLQKLLIDEGYAVMLSREEDLWCVNWVWTERFADRNDVVFISRDQYIWSWDEFLDHYPEIDWSKEK